VQSRSAPSGRAAPNPLMHDVLGIGVVTRTPKIDRELQQNHKRTHNAVEDRKTCKSIGPLKKSVPTGPAAVCRGPAPATFPVILQNGDRGVASRLTGD